MTNDVQKWNDKAKAGEEKIVRQGRPDGPGHNVLVRKPGQRKTPNRFTQVNYENKEALESIPTDQIEKFLEQRREKEKLEIQYTQAVQELQQVHAFAIDEFFAKAEQYNYAKTENVFDNEAFERYAAVYRESVDEILEAYWENSPHPVAVGDMIREFPLENKKRELRSRTEIMDYGDE
jgi:hypothetical protein